MQSEIDLRPYILAVIQRWRIIGLAVVVAMVITILIVIAQPRVYTATADVLILPSQSQLTFDSRFVTNNAPLATDVASRRQSLIGLLSSPALEDAVRPVLSGDLLQTKSGSLANRINVSAEGDLIHIKVQDVDPQQAQLLADAWAKAYTKLVNDLYGRPTDLLSELETQLVDAQQRYEASQQALETYLGTSDIVRLTQQISSTSRLLSEADTSTSLLYAQYQTQARALEATIQDAGTLRQQLLAGKVSEIGNNLALLALQARVIGEVQLPVELRFDDLNLLLESNTISAGDLARFIEILQQRRDELLSLSLEVMRSLHDGQATGAGISPELRVNYVQQLTQLYQELEEQNAQLRLLSSQRDQAFDEFSLIQKKLNEQRVMLGTSMIQVRYIDTTTVPPGSILRTLLLYSVAVAMLTVFVSIALIIAKMIIHMWQQEVSSFEEDKNSLKS